MTEMTFNDYVWFYGSIFLLMGVSAVIINQHWPDVFAKEFIGFHLAIGTATLLSGVFNGLWNFTAWVIHVFK